MAANARETYMLAHTAKCKLHLAANRPDRNLRFLLGHAFTLDKLMLRVAEIEVDSSGSDEDVVEDNGNPTCTATAGGRRVSFSQGAEIRNAQKATQVERAERRKSPPPDRFAHLQDTDSDSSNDEYEDLDDDDISGGDLQRFTSASAQPPRMIDDESSSSDEDEPRSPPQLSESEVEMITGGMPDAEMEDLYHTVAGCPCHGEKAPAVSKVWEVPGKTGLNGGRVAIVQVAS